MKQVYDSNLDQAIELAKTSWEAYEYVFSNYDKDLATKNDDVKDYIIDDTVLAAHFNAEVAQEVPIDDEQLFDDNAEKQELITVSVNNMNSLRQECYQKCISIDKSFVTAELQEGDTFKEMPPIFLEMIDIAWNIPVIFGKYDNKPFVQNMMLSIFRRDEENIYIEEASEIYILTCSVPAIKSPDVLYEDENDIYDKWQKIIKHYGDGNVSYIDNIGVVEYISDKSNEWCGRVDKVLPILYEGGIYLSYVEKANSLANYMQQVEGRYDLRLMVSCLNILLNDLQNHIMATLKI